MAKHKKDIGLQIIQKLHISAGRSMRSVYDEMNRRFGKERTGAYLAALPKDEATQGAANISAAYDIVNQDIELSRFMNGAHDADVIRRTATWIHDHREAFGQEILEVGCGVGFTTAVLALEFPDRHITTVDFSTGAIHAAETLLEELSLTNVTFVHADITDYVRDHPGEADTVFSMRTLRENYGDAASPGIDPQPLDLRLAHFLAPLGLPYACTLSRAAAPGGTLICVADQDEIAHGTSGWMTDLLCTGWTIDEDTFSRVPCHMPEGDALLELFVSRDRQDVDLDELQALDPESLARRSLDNARQVIGLRGRQLHFPGQIGSRCSGEEAEIACSLLQGEFILGLGAYDRQGHMIGRNVLYARRDLPGHYISLSVSAQEVTADFTLDERACEICQDYLAEIHDKRTPGNGVVVEWIQPDPETGLELPVKV